MELEKVLNEEQIDAVTSTSQYIKIVAGAGSGKTRVLTYRIAYLIEERKVHPLSILGITFTNKAAKEIKDRVSKMVEGAENMNLSTIHAWCAKFLRRFSSYIAYPKSFSILDEEDQIGVIKSIFVDDGYPKNDPNIKLFYSWMSSKKTDGIQYRDIMHEVYPNPLYNRFLKYYGKYTEILEKNHSLDFDDLLLKAIQILEDNIEVKETVSRWYSNILVDEFQDINDVQFYLIRLLMNSRTSLYVVGDPDQTIYTWRGANNRIILDLEESLKSDYPLCKVENILLVNNYRSSKNILNASNKLIANNKERVEKELIAVNPEGDAISFYSARSDKEEASYVATRIKELVEKGTHKYSDFAVLYRSNFLTREIESQFTLRRIPYKIFGGLKFYQRKEIKDVLAYINLIDNFESDISFDRIVNVPKRDIGPTTYEKIKSEANRLGQPVYLYCLESIDSLNLPKRKRDNIINFINIIDKTREQLQNVKSDSYAKTIETMLNSLGYFKMLEDEEERIENVYELINTISLYFKDNPEGTFSDFVENATLQASADEIDSGAYVSLMTVHIAKGLEFDSVFVYGFNELLFPSRRAVEEGDFRKIEEERRLAYVAMTRAEKKLYLTYNSDYSYVAGDVLKPSRFLYESGVLTKKTKISTDNKYLDNYINPFTINKPKEAPKPVIKTQTNGITDWRVGDKISHDTYGYGEITKIVSNKLIEVKFANNGTKTLLATHIAIKKLLS